LTQHELNCKKFQYILNELQTLISILKDLTDKFLVKTEESNRITLSPELSKALGKDEGMGWSLSESVELDALFRSSVAEKSLLEPEEFDHDDGGDMMLKIS